MRERIGPVILHLGLNKQPLKSGRHSAYIRVQYSAENRYYSCHSEFTPKEWASFEKEPDHDHPVMVSFRLFEKAVRELLRDDAFSFTTLSQMTRRRQGNTIQDLVSDYAESFRKQNKHNTADMYDALLSGLNTFLKSPLPAGRFTADTAKWYLDWLSDRGCGPTTVNIRARNLTAVLNKAVKDRIIPSNPMDGVRRPSVRRRNMNISRESLSKLLHADKSVLGEAHYKWLRYWKALYFANGMNIRDLLLLTRKNIQTSEIVFVRRKTEDISGREVHVPLTPELHETLSDLATGKEHLLPDLDGTAPESVEEHKRIRLVVANANRHLRAVRSILRIPEKITTYSARHTFATKLQQAGVPVEFISDAMGHSRISTTQNYLEGYTSDQRRKNAELLKV